MLPSISGINADGRHAHAAAHHADGAALIGAGVAVHAADVGDKARVLEEGLGNEFGAQRVAGHQDGLGEIAVFGAVMGGRHKSTLLYFVILVDTVYHTFAVCGKLKARNFVKEAFYHADTPSLHPLPPGLRGGPRRRAARLLRGRQHPARGPPCTTGRSRA